MIIIVFHASFYVSLAKALHQSQSSENRARVLITECPTLFINHSSSYTRGGWSCESVEHSAVSSRRLAVSAAHFPSALLKPQAFDWWTKAIKNERDEIKTALLIKLQQIHFKQSFASRTKLKSWSLIRLHFIIKTRSEERSARMAGKMKKKTTKGGKLDEVRI